MLKITQGEDKIFDLPMIEDGAAVDLTGLTAVSAKFKTASAPLEKTLGSGVAVTGVPTLGILRVTLTQSETATLMAGDVEFEVILDFSAIRKIILFKNYLTVEETIF